MGKKWLDIVYNEKSSVRLKEHYKNWASKYDNDLIDWGYAYPTQVKKILESNIKIKRNSKILDAGCGTGLVAETLNDMKFNNIIGLDYSVDMLKIAKSKKIYKKLIQESLSKKTTLRSNQFDVVLCTGVLTSGHVGAKAINELIRVTKNRGYLILSIAESIYEKLGFKNEIEKNNFQISKVKISKPFIALPNHESSATSKMHIYQKKLS